MKIEIETKPATASVFYEAFRVTSAAHNQIFPLWDQLCKRDQDFWITYTRFLGSLFMKANPAGGER